MIDERRRIRPQRRWAEAAQAAVLLGLPFLRIRGESALRFDVRTLTLHFFGAAIWMDELFLVLAATLFLGFAFLLATLLFGRAWCGWACPQTALADLTGFLERARAAVRAVRGGHPAAAAARRAGRARLALAYLAIALVSTVVAADLLWYFVPPREFFRRVAGLSLGPVVGGIWWTLALVLFLDLAFVRQKFCAAACPYAKLQGALLDSRSMIIAYDTRRARDCVDCGACVRVCPVGIDIRHGLQAACTACAECIDACQPIMRRLGRPPDLVGYVFGAFGREMRPARRGVLALGALTAAALALTVGVAAARTPLELTVAASRGFAPRRGADGVAYNAFELAFENRGREPLALSLSISAPPGVGAEPRPAEVTLTAGEHRQVRLMVAVRGLGPGARLLPAELVAEARRTNPVRASRALSLAAPAAREVP